MAPKKKVKSKQRDNDEIWVKTTNAPAKSLDSSTLSPGGNSGEDDAEPPQIERFGFGALSAALSDLDEDDGDAPKSPTDSSNKVAEKTKKKKKKKKAPIEAEVDEPLGEAAHDATDVKASVELSYEDQLDSEFGPVKEKKWKSKSKKAMVDDEDWVTHAPMAAVATEPTVEVGEEDQQPDEAAGTGGVLSKKEKERLKKEKEKAKKKAQAAAKRTAAASEGPAVESQIVVSTSVTDDLASSAIEVDSSRVAAEADDGDDGAEGPAESKKKKKKKKEVTKEEPKRAKKGGPNVAALRALMEKQREAEEAARRDAEEEQRRLDEEERKHEEEERLKEDAKQRKRDKEKQKREQLRKDGKLLTPKQKQEQAAALARREALLASGIKVEGLAGGDSKSLYSKKKTSQAARSPAVVPEPVLAKTSSSLPAVSPATIPESKPDLLPPAEEVEDDGIKDSWDASDSESDTEAAPVASKPAGVPGPAKAAPSVNGVKRPSPSCNTSGPSSSNSKSTSATKPAPPASKSASSSHSKPTVAKSAPIPTKPASTRHVSKPVPTESSEDEEPDESSDSDDDFDDSDSSEDARLSKAKFLEAKRKAEAAERKAQKHQEALAAQSKDNLRSPICCILGHVDTGKTKLLDKIRQTNVQDGEAGGITQQIGATYFPMDAVKKKTAVLKNTEIEYNLPGLLVIDTPGHESFTNLRSRGSSLCNIAILVVDIMHGLEPQTLESLRLLRDKKTPFIVALNKIDRLYDWKPIPNGGFRESLAKQNKAVQREFASRLQSTITAFAEQSLNAVLYYENNNFARNVSLVPTSAHTGEGIPDMLMLLVKLTQERMSENLMYLAEVQCTVLEVKVIEGLGTTIDVVLSNGVLHEGDRIVVCSSDGTAIVTQIRALLTPQPLRELRIKGTYVHHKEVKASLGIKIVAPDLEKAIAGSRLLVVGEDDDLEALKGEVQEDLTSLLNSVDRSGKGVWVQASTLGSLEALLDFLKSSEIPVAGINIGPVHKKDVVRASVMIERAPDLAIALCFDVSIDKEAEKLAEEVGLKIFKADIIYHLFDQFKAHHEMIQEEKRKDSAPKAVWPCRLRIIQCFAKRDPIILGCDIIEGNLRIGTPLCVVKTDTETKQHEVVSLGKVVGLEINHKSFDLVKRTQAGGGVAVKIEHAVYEAAKMFGRHFDEKDEVLSMISRESIDTLKAVFRKDVSEEEWKLIVRLKPLLDIP